MNTEPIPVNAREAKSFQIFLAEKFAALLSSPEEPTLFDLRFQSLRELHARLLGLQERNYHMKMLCGIAEKKSEMILNAKSKTELKAIMHPKPPHFNGQAFQADPYLTPEEELICWSEASLRAPLNSAGYERFIRLFLQVLPEEYEKLWGEAP